VQQARRDADLQVSDRIVLTLGVDEVLKSQISVHEALIAGETLATEVVWDTTMERPVAIEGASIGVSVARSR
jgi:isoleucyl-tRNA synthetase